MNLKEEITKEMWDIISVSYIKESYTGAIQDAIFALSELIREKSNLSSDGVALVGSAFGTTPPKIKLNRLQTETEKTIQAGMQDILRGVYRLIRNPRSHNKYKDDKATANTIIIFIDYLYKQINVSKTSFSIEQIKARVFDDDFVKNERYAELIIEDIPKLKYLDTLIEIYRSISQSSGIEKREYFFNKLIKKLSPENKKDFFQVISDNLKITNDLEVIKTSLFIVKKDWHMIEESAKIRIENKLIKSIKNAKIYENGQSILYNNDAIFSIWIKNIIGSKLILETELENALICNFCSLFCDEESVERNLR